MKHSEFYDAVEATFGSALGRSYVSDLYLASLGATARDALSAGVNPDEVWATLCEETGREDARWIHRVDPRERGALTDPGRRCDRYPSDRWAACRSAVEHVFL